MLADFEDEEANREFRDEGDNPAIPDLDETDLDDGLYTEENPEGIVAFGVWHRIERMDGRLVLVEVPMAQYKGQNVEEDNDDSEFLELDELSEAWAQAVIEQGANLAEGESVYFCYPEDADEDDLLED